ncbi:hypothetical protein MI467_10740 [Delftia acidovorans]|uniref:hypothetical protein n=1 Tax=Delftia acidovorans TaxID=80866 RepID=UPI001EFE6EF4|nr:hypothetical protein [Delftia acidovorans]MCG8987312.1 hypothetical protein [Delftia acidovorans]
MKQTTKILLSTNIAFILASCGGGSDGPHEAVSAESCFDITTYSPGSAIQQKYEDTRSSPPGRSLWISIASTNATFNGKSDLLAYKEMRIPTEHLPMGFGSSLQTSYLSPITEKELTTHGKESEFAGAQLKSFEKIIYTPAWIDKKFKLKQGESLKYSIAGNSTTSSLSNPIPVSKDINTEIEVVFEGKDAVAIGSRSVTACRFNYGTHRDWIYKGILIKMDDGTGKTILKTTELTRSGQLY